MSRILDLDMDQINESDLMQGFVAKQYDSEDHNRWKTMFKKVQSAHEGVACSSYVKGIHALEDFFTDIPKLNELNVKLEQETGWRIMAVDGILGCEEFYKLLSRRIFPSATFVRDWHVQSFTGYPDLFHDVVGHLPLFFDKDFAEFVATSSALMSHSGRKSLAFRRRL